MSKKNDRKLSIKRETLRQLDAGALGAVAGGGTYVKRTTNCDYSYNCAATLTCGKTETVGCPSGGCADM